MTEREEFEAWFQRRYVCGDFNSSREVTAAMGHAWSAWQAARRTVRGQEARMLAYELEGVVIDSEREGGGFDAVCLNTVKRVRDALYAPIPATDAEKDAALTDAQANSIYERAHDRVCSAGGYETNVEFQAMLVRAILAASKEKKS